MKVEIWSDVMCPFCYIGKRKFEKALENFPDASAIEIEWKAFQLNPDMKTNPNVSIHEYLAEAKGWSVEQARQMNGQVTQMAAEVGLSYDFEKSVVANSFNAHRFTHVAKTLGKGNELVERIFKAYFTEGANIDDTDTLKKLSTEVGITEDQLEPVLTSDAFAGEVTHDIREAQQLGVRGVPFFVFNRKYAVSGAQQPETFLGALQKSYAEWQAENPAPLVNLTDGPVCTPEGNC